MMRWLAAMAVIVTVVLSTPLSAEPRPQIAIIIDDLGYAVPAGERVVRLPGPVACAILPGTPAARRLAVEATARGKEVLVHLPMQAAIDDDGAEPGSITLDMSRIAFVRAFNAALASVPGAIGVNNHRGSLLTRHPGHMQWLMDEIRADGSLFFVDSYTTHKSVALTVARETGVDAVKRDIFLDSRNTPDAVASAFERLKSLARRRGSAVAIGHPYEHTLALLERELPKLEEQGFDLVPISALAMRR
ncbi:MAG: divergent polysaccharide deacetylase family protein [Pseudomonadota bacterium]